MEPHDNTITESYNGKRPFKSLVVSLGEFDKPPLQREINGQAPRQRVAGEQGGIAFKLRPVALGALGQFAVGQADGLVVDDPAAAVGDEAAVDDMVGHALAVVAAPRLLGAGLRMN